MKAEDEMLVLVMLKLEVCNMYMNMNMTHPHERMNEVGGVTSCESPR